MHHGFMCSTSPLLILFGIHFAYSQQPFVSFLLLRLPVLAPNRSDIDCGLVTIVALFLSYFVGLHFAYQKVWDIIELICCCWFYPASFGYDLFGSSCELHIVVWRLAPHQGRVALHVAIYHCPSFTLFPDHFPRDG